MFLLAEGNKGNKALGSMLKWVLEGWRWMNSRNFPWGLNRASGCVRLGERAGDNLVSLSPDEAIRRIVALLRSAGDELDRQVRAVHSWMGPRESGSGSDI